MNNDAFTKERIEYVPFPTELLPEPLKPFIVEVAKSIGREDAFIALPILTAFGAAIGTSYCVEVKKGWQEHPIIWSGIIGDSGTKKTPAIKLATSTFHGYQKSAHKEYLKELKEYEIKKMHYDVEFSAWKSKAKSEPSVQSEPPIEPMRPLQKRYVVVDTTVEAIIEILSANPRGLLMVRDELAGFMTGMNQYKGNKGSDQEQLLEMHSGGTIYVDRKTAQRLQVDTAALSITGGIQLPIMQKVMTEEQFNNGLMARFLLACPPCPPCEWTEEQVSDGLKNRVRQVMEGIYNLTPLQDGTPTVVCLSESARALWKDFYNLHNIAISKESTSDMKAVLSKLEAYVLRFALIIHCVKWVNDRSSVDQLTIGRESLESAIGLAQWFEQETRRIYTLLGKSRVGRDERLAMKWIQENEVDGYVTVRDFYRSRNVSKDEALNILSQLQILGFGTVEYGKMNESGGKPSELFVLHDNTSGFDTENEGIVSVSNNSELESK